MKKVVQFKIKKDYQRMSDGNFEFKMLTIITGLNNNENFPSLPIPITQLSAAHQAFSAALVPAKNRGMKEAAAKNETRQVATVMLDTVAAYCQSVALASRSVLLSSGFSVTSDTRSTRTLGTPSNFTVTPGPNSGTVVLTLDTCDNAASYLFEWASSPNQGTWLHDINTKPVCTVTGLTSMHAWDFKAAAVGSRNQKVYTDTITKPVA